MDFVLNDKSVIVKSIELIKGVINKLDSKTEGLNGVDIVLDQVSPNDVMTDPKKLLDQLIIYLFCVHRVDWYSDSWEVGNAKSANLTVRPEPRMRVFSKLGEEAEISAYLEKLDYRTKAFIQV